MPASAMDAAGGGSCDAAARRRGRSRRRLQAGEPADVDVKVAQLKNVYASDDDATNSDLVQIEMGGGGTTVKVDGLEEPIILVIGFEAYDRTLEPDFEKKTVTDTCLNRTQILNVNCSVPTTFNCSVPQFVETKFGNKTLLAPRITGGGDPVAVSVTCPGSKPACTFWDDNSSSWGGDGCSVVNYTGYNVTCACTHLTDFAGSTGPVGSTAGAVVSTLLSMNLADLLEALTVLITLMAALGLFAFLYANGVSMDKQDENDRNSLRNKVLPPSALEASGRPDVISRATQKMVLAAAFKAKDSRPWLLAPSTYRSYQRSVVPVKNWTSNALYGFVQAMRREHKILQIFYLPDGTFTRSERAMVLCILVFSTLLANALILAVLTEMDIPLIKYKVDSASEDPVNAQIAGVLFSTLAALIATGSYLVFAFLFQKTGEPTEDVDHFLGVSDDNLDKENRGRVQRRREVIAALAEYENAKIALTRVGRLDRKDLERTVHYHPGEELGVAHTMSHRERVEFGQRCQWRREEARLAVQVRHRSVQKAQLKFANFSKKCKDRRREKEAKTSRDDASFVGRFLPCLKPKPPQLHVLTLDERALYEAEEEELKTLPLDAKIAFKAHVSPLRKALKSRHQSSWHPRWNTVFFAMAALWSLLCAVYVFGFSVQLNQCAACERQDFWVCLDRDANGVCQATRPNYAVTSEGTDPPNLPKWAVTDWAAAKDRNLCRSPSTFLACDSSPSTRTSARNWPRTSNSACARRSASSASG